MKKNKNSSNSFLNNHERLSISISFFDSKSEMLVLYIGMSVLFCLMTFFEDVLLIQSSRN